MALGTLPAIVCVSVPSPLDAACEKNWPPMPDGTVSYAWGPFRRGSVSSGRLELEAGAADVPAGVERLRVSAPPFRVGAKWLALAHVVVGFHRKYLSVLVELARPSGHPLSWSLPFVFLELGIEHCLSALRVGDEVHFFMSSVDRGRT